jgi:hypothetical protein
MTTITPTTMTAEILFDCPERMKPAIAHLTELGFEVEVLDWVGPELDDDHVWVLATIRCELDQNEFLDWMMSIVEPFHGDVVDAGDAAAMAADMPRKNRDAIVVRMEREARKAWGIN